MRVFSNQRPDMYIYIHDGLRGWAFPPNVSGWAKTDFPMYVTFNGDGFNDYSHPVAKKPGVVRIAVLGDSMTAETMLPKPEIFTSVLQRKLPETEVFNFGVNAYNTEQCRRVLDDIAWKYKPQIIVLLLTFQSGIAYNVRELGYSDDSSAPYMVLRDGTLVPDAATARMRRFGPVRTALENNIATLANRSRLFLSGCRAWENTWRRVRPHKPLSQSLVRNINMRPYIPEVDSDLVRGWAITEALLISIRNDVESHGAKFVIVVPGLPMQTLPNVSEREAFRNSIGVSSLYNSNDKLRELCERDHLALIDMAKPMGDYAASHSVALYGFGPVPNAHEGHWNSHGNLVGGHILARALSEIVTRVLR